MTLLENGKERLVSQDEMKVMIARDHSPRCHPTRRLDNEDTWDDLASEVKKVVETSAKAMRKMQASLSSLDQRISALRKKYQGRSETSHLQDSQSQTCHTRNDESGLNPQRDSRPTKEGREQDGPLRRPSNEPNDRPEKIGRASCRERVFNGG